VERGPRTLKDRGGWDSSEKGKVFNVPPAAKGKQGKTPGGGLPLKEGVPPLK